MFREGNEELTQLKTWIPIQIGSRFFTVSDIMQIEVKK